MTVSIVAAAIGIIGCGYVIFGGLRACAISDTINGIGLIIGGLLIPILALVAIGGGDLVGGFKELIDKNPAKLNAIGNHESSVPWTVLLTGLLFNNLFTGVRISPSSSGPSLRRIWLKGKGSLVRRFIQDIRGILPRPAGNHRLFPLRKYSSYRGYGLSDTRQ